MVSGYVTPEGKGQVTRSNREGNIDMAPTKKSSSKPAGKFAVKAGPSGKMAKFTGASAQQPGVTHRTNSAGKGAAFPEGGPSGKMHGFSPVKPQKSGRSSQS